MTWLKDAIEFVREKAVQDARSEFRTFEDDPSGLWEFRPNLPAYRHDCKPDYRHTSVHSIADICSIAKAHFDPEIASTRRMAIFYCFDLVELIFDVANGFESATLHLITSQEWAWFQERKPRSLTTDELRTALQWELHAAAPKSLLEKLSKLNYVRQQTREDVKDRGRESMGASITSEVTQPEELPDSSQMFSVKPWENVDYGRHKISILLEADLERQGWGVMVTDSFNDAIKMAEDSLGHAIQAHFEENDTRPPLYRGSWSRKALQ